MEQNEKMTLVVLSGDLDKVMASYIIATGAAAAGMDVVMFFTFWGLKAIQRGNLTGKSLFGRMLGAMNRGGLNAIGPSRLNMGGMGRWMFKLMMKQKGVTQLPELQQAAIDLGVKLMPCQMSMDVMEIDCDDLIAEAMEPVGVATMLEHARESKIQFFI
ncbi:MAG: DsrE/DsrF/DrsH-like family protein [Anaerolineales bacterium]|nr:DsrE/DsrF/DrsH-like family protein [Anaerolineales bacterium]